MKEARTTRINGLVGIITGKIIQGLPEIHHALE